MSPIRLAQDADAEAIAAIYRPIVESTPISFELVPPDRDEMAARLARTLPSHPWLVCEIGGGVGGYAYAGKFNERAAYRWSATVSVYIDARYRRCGVGRALYASLFRILVAQGFFNAYAGVTLPNTSSVGLHEAVGFRRVGGYERVGFKAGQWYDVGWWQLALQPLVESPAEPLDLATVQKRADWPALLAAGESGLRAEG